MPSMSRPRLLTLAALLLLLATLAGPSLVSAQTVEFSGTAFVSDDAALSDKITYDVTSIADPSTGTEYVGWMVSQKRKLSTGPMAVVDNAISYSFDSNSPRYTGENLIQNFSTIVITEEAAGTDPDQPAGPAVYSYTVPAGAMAHIRHLVADWPPGSGVGILTNLNLQVNVAVTHANLAKASLDAGDLDGVKQHLEHVINAIEGPDGPNYGDVNGDGAVQDFGDGLGVLFHAADSKHAGFAAGTVPDDTVFNAHADLVAEYAANATRWSNKAVSQALKIIDSTSLPVAAQFLGPGGNTVISLTEAADNGNDLTSGAGGAKQAYTEGQLMATYTLAAGGPAEGEVEEGSGTGGPSVGDSYVPLAAQMVMLTAILLIGAGSITLVARRKVRVRS